MPLTPQNAAGWRIEPPVSVAVAAGAADPPSGRVLYAENCMDCHGESGKGDDEVAPDIPDPIPALAHGGATGGGSQERSLGAVGLTGPEKFRDPTWPAASQQARSAYGDDVGPPEAVADEVAAVVLEPMNAAFPPEGWLARVADG